MPSKAPSRSPSRSPPGSDWHAESIAFACSVSDALPEPQHISKRVPFSIAESLALPEPERFAERRAFALAERIAVRESEHDSHGRALAVSIEFADVFSIGGADSPDELALARALVHPHDSPTQTVPLAAALYFTENYMQGAFGGLSCRTTANAVCASQPAYTRLGCYTAFFLGGCATDELPLSYPYAPGVNKRISTTTPVLGSALIVIAQNWSALWSLPLQATLQKALLNATSSYYWSGLAEDTTTASPHVTVLLTGLRRRPRTTVRWGAL